MQILEKHHDTILPVSVERVLAEFEARQSDKDALQLLLQYARQAPSLLPEQRSFDNRVMGCTAQVIG